MSELVIDDWVDADELSAELGDWSRGQFRLRGDVFDIVWVDGPEAEAIRAQLAP